MLGLEKTSAREEEVYFLLGELKNLQRKLWLFSSPTRSKQNKVQESVKCWYNSLSGCQRELVNIVDAPQPLSNEIKSILQNGIVSDINFLSSDFLLLWHRNGTSPSLRVIKRGVRFESCDIHGPDRLTEREFLECIGITWKKGIPVDFRFYEKRKSPQSIISYIEKISTGNCFADPYLKAGEVRSLSWLKERSCFSLAELLAGLLEIRIFECFTNRKKLKPYLESSVIGSTELMHSLKKIFEKCDSNDTKFKAIVYRKCAGVLMNLTHPHDETVTLYLSIMKKKLSNWRSDSPNLPPDLIFKRLWALHFFSDVLFKMRSSRLMPDNRSIRTHSSTKEIIRNLMVVPLMDSFSLLHEFRLQLRDGLISDHHAADLLQELDENKGCASSACRKKKSKKKKRKQKTTPLSQSSVGKRNECSYVSKGNDFSEAIAPKDVTRSVKANTQIMVEIYHIIDIILENAMCVVIQQSSFKAPGHSAGVQRENPSSNFSIVEDSTQFATSSDIGFYDSFYALPSWVNEDNNGTDDCGKSRFFCSDQLNGQNSLGRTLVSSESSNHIPEVNVEDYLFDRKENEGYPSPLHLTEICNPMTNTDVDVLPFQEKDDQTNTTFPYFDSDEGYEFLKNRSKFSDLFSSQNEANWTTLSIQSCAPNESEVAVRQSLSCCDPHECSITKKLMQSRQTQTTLCMPRSELTPASTSLPKKMRGRSLSPTSLINSRKASQSNQTRAIRSQSFSSDALIEDSLNKSHQNQSPQCQKHLIQRSHASTQEDLPSRLSSLLIFSSSCTQMISQAETIVLRNITALQRSMFMSRHTPAQPQPRPPYNFPPPADATGADTMLNCSKDVEMLSEDDRRNMERRLDSSQYNVNTGATAINPLAFKDALFAQAPLMASVPNSPVVTPAKLSVQKSGDVFPVLPTTYSAYYLAQPTQPLHRDDESIYYRNLFPHRGGAVADSSDIPLAPTLSPMEKTASSRPRSASASRKQSSSQQMHGMYGAAGIAYEANRCAELRRGPVEDPPVPVDLRLHYTDKTSLNVEIEKQTAESNRLMKTYSEATEFGPLLPPVYSPAGYAQYAHEALLNGRLDCVQSPLSREILNFVERADAFGAKMQSAKATAILRLRQVVQQLWPRAQVKAFGSYVSGLSLPSSDLDLVINLPKVLRVAGPSAPGFLEGRNAIKDTWQNILARCLRRESWVDVSSMKVISSTAVPVIKLVTSGKTGSRVSLDISFGSHSHRGIEASQYNITLIREYPPLRGIVLVLKKFLSDRGLCEVFTGGLSSYAILLMTAKFLHEHKPKFKTDVGAALLGMLDFYGNHFQPSVTGISVADMSYFPRNDNSNVLNAVPYSRSAIIRRHSLRHGTNEAIVNGPSNESRMPYKFDPLFIEDPLDRGNNVGRNCFRIHQVQKVFSDAHKSILESIDKRHRQYSQSRSLLILKWSPDGSRLQQRWKAANSTTSPPSSTGSHLAGITAAASSGTGVFNVGGMSSVNDPPPVYDAPPPAYS